jgi:hypothetical protein
MTKKKEVTILPGMSIEIDESKKDVVRNIVEIADSRKQRAKILMGEAAKLHDDADKEFWKAIHEIFPGVVGWSFSIHKEKLKLLIHRKLSNLEEENMNKRLIE